MKKPICKILRTNKNNNFKFTIKFLMTLDRSYIGYLGFLGIDLFKSVLMYSNGAICLIKLLFDLGLFTVHGRRKESPQRGPGLSSLDGEIVGVQDGGMERQRTLTLPERPQRGYWQFLYKYPSKYHKYISAFHQTKVPNQTYFDIMLSPIISSRAKPSRAEQKKPSQNT